jgi:DNA-binding transcriptional MerR regulator
MKTRGAHRVYRRRDVELAMLVRRLLQEEGFTITGARKRLKELGRDRVSSEPDPEAKREVNLRAELLWIRRELNELLKQIEHAVAGAHAAERPQVRATVTAAVPSAVRVRGRTST